MKNFFNRFCLFTLVTIGGLQANSNFKVGAYYENWAINRKGNAPNAGTMPGSAVPEGFINSINPAQVAKNLDVINYAFALFNWNHVLWNQCLNDSNYAQYIADWNVTYSDPIDDPQWLYQGNSQAPTSWSAPTRPFTVMKAQNSSLKLMLSLGGWNFCQNIDEPEQGCYNYSYGKYTYEFFSQMVADPIKYNKFFDSLFGVNGSKQFTPTQGSQQGQVQTAFFWLQDANGNFVFDGIDLDWEYPGQYNTADYDNYISFIKALRQKINVFNAANCSRDISLSMCIPPFIPNNLASGAASWSGGSYPTGIQGPDGSNTYSGGTISITNPSTYFAWMSIVANCCDWVNLMSYDMYGAFSTPQTVQFQAPLYNGKFQAGYTPNQQDATNVPLQTTNQGYSIDYAIWMWTTGATYGGTPTGGTTTVGLGISPAKIQLGLPAYGRSYSNNTTLFSTTNPIGNSFTAAGPAQPFTNAAGLLAYYEAVPLFGSSEYLQKFTSNGGALAGVGGDNATAAQSWVVQNNAGGTNSVYVYDSVKDIQTKVNYAQSKGLGGVFFYPITQDYITGTSGYNFQNSLLKKGVIDVLAPSGPSGAAVNISNRSP